jgi:ribonuclease HI
VKWDAAVDKSNGRMGLKVVVRDHSGKLCASKSLTRRGFLEPAPAEATAVLVAVHMCCELGLQQVWLEGDAKVVVDAVNAREPVWTRWGHLVEDISLTLQNVSCWKMSFV